MGPNPPKFDPSRHMHDTSLLTESAARADPAERDHLTFGLGRRICPGMHVAGHSLFLAIARMLWTFKTKEGKTNTRSYRT